jgi:hypothetical protein
MGKPLEELLEVEKKFVGQVLTYAEVGLPETQFRRFKQLVMDSFHEKLKPETIRILKNMDQVEGSAE